MITVRQQKLLDFLIKEYINTAMPVSSFDLKKITDLNISAATVRNDLQDLAKEGYIEQPHTSAGRVPTQKAYKYFADRFFTKQSFDEDASDFIEREVRQARQRIEREMNLAEELMNSLSQVSFTLDYKRIEDKDNLFEMLTILGPAKESYSKNIDIINSLLKELRNF